MRLVPRELEIGPEEGFPPEKNIFNRKPFGEQLTRIVRAVEGPAVLLLDGQWGTGKTIFAKMWLGELTKVAIPTIYFDAFTNDYHDDAFLTVAGEIVARAEELKPRGTRALEKFKTVQLAWQRHWVEHQSGSRYGPRRLACSLAKN